MVGILPMWAGVGVRAVERGRERGREATGMGMVGPPKGMLARDVNAWRG